MVIAVSRCMKARVLGSSTAMTRRDGAAAVPEVAAGEDLRALRRGPLAEPEHDGAVADHQDVAALAGGGVVHLVVVAVVHGELVVLVAANIGWKR